MEVSVVVEENVLYIKGLGVLGQREKVAMKLITSRR